MLYSLTTTPEDFKEGLMGQVSTLLIKIYTWTVEMRGREYKTEEIRRRRGMGL